MEIYSYYEGEWRGKLKKGEFFKSKEFFECKLCKIKTNLLRMSLSPYTFYPIIICKNEKNHDILKKYFKKYKETIELINDYKNYNKTIPNYLISKKNVLKKRIIDLRK
jgi:hypothetical protein